MADEAPSYWILFPVSKGKDIEVLNADLNNNHLCCCCCSVTKWCLTLYDPMDYSMPNAKLRLPNLSLFRFMSFESVMPSDHLILCHPLLLFPSIFPNIRVFSKESALHIYSSVQFSSVAQSCPTLCSANKPFHVVSAVLLRLQESVCASDW